MTVLARSLPVLAATIGDPAGVGPDIILQAWLGRARESLAPFYVIGDAIALRSRAKELALDVPICETRPEDAAGLFAASLPVVSVAGSIDVVAGKPDPRHAPMILGAIERAVDDVIAGKASALVTAPIAKKPLYDAGFEHPGHTEFLGALAAQKSGELPTPVMMIAGPKLRVVPVTIHIPLADVPRSLSAALIEQTCRIVDADLRSRFGVARPRLAVAGLNPHAGENGALGSEEREIISPAIKKLVSSGIDARGPLPADTMFHDRARAAYDVAICMYHDQALVPAKALGFDDSVNVTLGLPFIRTSPDHGTAFDIAGSGKARPDSFIAAINMAADMAERSRRAEAA
jgi:4-hydroxythreonine-4-phosphate dehydrogenase